MPFSWMESTSESGYRERTLNVSFVVEIFPGSIQRNSRWVMVDIGGGVSSGCAKTQASTGNEEPTTMYTA